MRVECFIGRDSDHLEEVTFFVDTGAFYTMLPPRLRNLLGIETTLRVPVITADSRVVQVRLGVAYLRIEDRAGGVPVGEMEVPEPLLGVTALEALGFKVNAVEGRLERDRPYGPAVLPLL